MGFQLKFNGIRPGERDKLIQQLFSIFGGVVHLQERISEHGWTGIPFAEHYRRYAMCSEVLKLIAQARFHASTMLKAVHHIQDTRVLSLSLSLF